LRMCSAEALALCLLVLLRWRRCLLCDPPPAAWAVPAAAGAVDWSVWARGAIVASGDRARPAPKPMARIVFSI